MCQQVWEIEAAEGIIVWVQKEGVRSLESNLLVSTDVGKLNWS